MVKLKRYQRSPKRPCYYCGAPPPSLSEHAPPRALFKAADCDMITVPSCDAHNSEKSFADKAVLTAMAKVVLEGYKVNSRDQKYTPNIMKTVASIEAAFSEVAQLVTWQGFYVEPEPWQTNDMVYFKTSLFFLDWVRQLTAAVVWHVVGEPQSNVVWDAVEVYNPYFYTGGPYQQDEGNKAVLDSEYKRLVLDDLTWHRGWSAHPKPYPRDIFRFDLSFDTVESYSTANVTFRHTFFNGDVLFYVPIEFDRYNYEIIRSAVT